MDALTNRVKQVERKPHDILGKDLPVPAIAKGMGITFSHIFKKKPTINYPEENENVHSPVFRGLHILTGTKKDGNVARPVVCARLPARPKPSPWKRGTPAGEEHLYREEKYAAKYEINMLRCIFCGLCEEACPKDAIYLTADLCASQLWRKGFIYRKEELLIPDPITKPEAYEKAKGNKGLGKDLK